MNTRATLYRILYRTSLCSMRALRPGLAKGHNRIAVNIDGSHFGLHFFFARDRRIRYRFIAMQFPSLSPGLARSF